MPIQRLERLLNLTAALLDTTVPVSAEHIRARVEGYDVAGDAFGRQFERDKDALREMGVPITVADAPGYDPPVPGYLIRPSDYYLEDPGFAPDELAVLHLASRVINFDPSDATSGLWKLGGVPDHDAQRTQDVAAMAALPSDPNLSVAFKAALATKSVSFHYRGHVREVHDVRLAFRRGNWYLVGHDGSADEPRTFRLDRIEGEIAELPGSRDAWGTAPKQLGTLDPWSIGDAPPILATIHFDRVVAPTVLHEIGLDKLTERSDDGAITVSLPVTNPDGFRSWVLGYLDHAVVLDPPELVDGIVSWLVALVEEVH